jgi:hypothetical protein
MENRKGSQRILVENPEVKGPLGIPGRRWEDNIKMDLQVVRYCLGHEQVAGVCECGNEASVP